MLRDKNLIPLSHQHQRALALCVRIDRAQPIPSTGMEQWQEEIENLFEQEIKIHFTAEEEVLFPTASRFSELIPLVKELTAEHEAMRVIFSLARDRKLTPDNLPRFAHEMSAHIRREERLLFERLQTFMSPEELREVGKLLEAALSDATHFCRIVK